MPQLLLFYAKIQLNKFILFSGRERLCDWIYSYFHRADVISHIWFSAMRALFMQHNIFSVKSFLRWFVWFVCPIIIWLILKKNLTSIISLLIIIIIRKLIWTHQIKYQLTHAIIIKLRRNFFRRSFTFLARMLLWMLTENVFRA